MNELVRDTLAELNARELRAVVVGGSAGGIEALNALLPALSRNLAVPVAVVIHLPPDRPSMLPQLFETKCAVPVREAADKDTVEPGVVYFAPPGYHLLFERDGLFSLSVDEPVHHSRPSIDVLFDSAVWAFEGDVLGIVLSGANSDGAQGLSAIMARGGLGWVQLPSSAYATAMPEAASALCAKARVLSLDQMVAVLTQFSHEPLRRKGAIS